MRDFTWVLEGNALTRSPYPGPVRVIVHGDRILSAGSLDSDAPESGSGTWARPAPRHSHGPVPGEAPVWTMPRDTWVLPGFIDGHTHLLGVGLAGMHPDLSAARSAAQALEMLSGWLGSHPGDQPVVAHGWDQSDWSPPRLPHRTELDRIAPSRPVVLRRVCGHVAVLNSAALALLGVDWPDLDVETGLALESLPLAMARLLPASPAQVRDAVRIARDKAWSRGITAAHDMGHTGDALPFRAYAAADMDGELGLRIHYYYGVELLDTVARAGLTAGMGSDCLRVGGIKLFLDGSFGGHSAAMRDPYQGKDERGLLLWKDNDLLDVFHRASSAGLPLAIHAIGDRAIDQAISAAERAAEEGYPKAAPGPRLEHAESLDRDLIERASQAGFLFSMQPNFTARWQGPGGLYESVLGAGRAIRLNPYRSAAAAAPMHFGSDCMPMNPLTGLAGALGHPEAGERLSLVEAVRRFTEHGACAVPNPFNHGRLEPGAAADLVLLRIPGLDRPESALEPDGPGILEGAAVVGTVFAGRLRWAADALPVPHWMEPAG